MSIVLELQRESMNPDVDIVSLLRKAKAIAAKLERRDDILWIDRELNGYKEGEILPEYRFVSVRIMARAGDNTVPVNLGSETEAQNEHYPCFNSIPYIYEIISDDGVLAFNLPQDMLEFLYEYRQLDYYYEINRGSLKEILMRVQTLILDWALALEKKGIFGEDLIFDMSEIEAAQTIPAIIHNTVIVNGEASSLQIMQSSACSTQAVEKSN